MYCMSMMVSSLLLAWTNNLLYIWRWVIIIGSEAFCRWLILGMHWLHPLHFFWHYKSYNDFIGLSHSSKGRLCVSMMISNLLMAWTNILLIYEDNLSSLISKPPVDGWSWECIEFIHSVLELVAFRLKSSVLLYTAYVDTM